MSPHSPNLSPLFSSTPRLLALLSSLHLAHLRLVPCMSHVPWPPCPRLRVGLLYSRFFFERRTLPPSLWLGRGRMKYTARHYTSQDASLRASESLSDLRSGCRAVQPNVVPGGLPPATRKLAPATYEASSEQSQTTASAISCGVPIRPSGIWLKSNVLADSATMSVLVMPGETCMRSHGGGQAWRCGHGSAAVTGGEGGHG